MARPPAGHVWWRVSAAIRGVASVIVDRTVTTGLVCLFLGEFLIFGECSGIAVVLASKPTMSRAVVGCRLGYVSRRHVRPGRDGDIVACWRLWGVTGVAPIMGTDRASRGGICIEVCSRAAAALPHGHVVFN